ncbi:hypothetical [Yersinia pestis KIM10+]|uniref:Uncharacterized protein n=1 Tax=Yersinia pestis TaxID=632 RepID=Q8CKU4_YERPE|nr:hypothetical [Yersinia pestis KIM10+]
MPKSVNLAGSPAGAQSQNFGYTKTQHPPIGLNAVGLPDSAAIGWSVGSNHF